MSITRYIGDVHGLKCELEIILQNTPDYVSSVVQVGDIGIGFGQGAYWHNKLDQMMSNANARFIRGNHDSPRRCKKFNSWIPDGLVENDVMHIGGAWSIDYHWRTQDVNWWNDEELSYSELIQLLDVYSLTQPRIMVTHDFPESAAKKMFFENPHHLCFGRDQYKTRTASALETMFQSHTPDLWIGGHWHHDVDMLINGTRFVCLDELSYIDVDMETLEIVKKSVG